MATRAGNRVGRAGSEDDLSKLRTATPTTRAIEGAAGDAAAGYYGPEDEPTRMLVFPPFFVLFSFGLGYRDSIW